MFVKIKEQTLTKQKPYDLRGKGLAEIPGSNPAGGPQISSS